MKKKQRTKKEKNERKKRKKTEKNERPLKPVNNKTVDRRFVSYLAEVNVLALLTNWFLSVYKYLVSVSNLNPNEDT